MNIGGKKMEFKNLISKIVEGMEIKKGMKVVLNFWGENKDLDLLDEFVLSVEKCGAIPIRVQQSREYLKRYFEEVSEEFLVDESIDDIKFEVLKNAEVAIDIFTYGVMPHKDFAKEKMDLYRAYLGKVFSSLSTGKEIFVQVRIPTEENALEEGIDYEVYKKAMCDALTVDYKTLKLETKNIIGRLQGKKIIEIYTGEDSKLTLNLGNREWCRDDGIGDIPCGEIYIAPLEESANGEIVIPNVILEDRNYKDVVLSFENGKLINSSERGLMEYISEVPGDSDIIAEFGIGLNDKITALCGCSVIDEKMKGTAHIAIGMNNMFGGKNKCPMHMDFIFVPKEIRVDDKIIMNKNRLYL